MAQFLQPLGPVAYEGLDVSELQGEIDFARVRAAGKRAVYIRAGVGYDYADSLLSTNYENARAAGLLVGFFHYATARNAEDARQQARFFVDLVRGKHVDLRLAMEFTYFPGLTRDEINAIATAFLETVEAESGKGAVLFARASGADGIWNAALAEAYPLWAIEPGVALPEGNDLWQGWVGFLFSDAGRVDGVTGPVNLDRFTQGILAGEAGVIAGAAAEVPARDTKLICHTVAWGDTLWALSRLYGTTVQTLVRLNDIANANLIFPGQRLYVPVSTATFGACCDSYTVRRGDTLSGIAARFSTTARRLAGINRIADPDRIYPGELIRLGLCP